MEIALPSLFAPHSLYMAYIAGTSPCTIWSGERYVKQTLRNRTEFLSPAGRFSFSLPVQKYKHPAPAISQILISEHGQWRPKLAHALMTAYSSAPYWEHYEDRIHELVYYNDSNRLLDFNTQWLDFFCDAWMFTKPISSEELREGQFFHAELGSRQDTSTSIVYPRYWQVFESKFGFTSGLSALDLLMTQGPEGRIYLMNLYESIRK